MSKRMPGVEAPVWEAPASPNAFSLEIKTITPLSGGGYKTRECDELIPIRSATVRGHLRFWWRATAEAQFSSVQELYERECELWGGPSEKNKIRVGKVGVRVEVLQKGTKEPHSQIAPKSRPKDGPLPGFFLFPFQEVKNQNIPEASGLKGVRFKLYIDYTDAVDDRQKQEVQTAIKAWLTFGGVGARTRRGCGALEVLNQPDWLLPDSPQERDKFLKQLLVYPDSEQSEPTYPVLAGATVVVGEPQSDPMQVWKELGRFWARFRKGHFVDNKEYSPMSGGKWNDYRGVLCHLEKFSDKKSLSPSRF